MAVRVSQVAVEALVQPTTANARVSQVAVEVLARPTTANARVSQVAVEVLMAMPPGTLAQDLRVKVIQQTFPAAYFQ